LGQLYDAIEQVSAEVERRGLDVAKVKGEIGLHAGFFLAIVFPHTPDDAEKLERLKKATRTVLGADIFV